MNVMMLVVLWYKKGSGVFGNENGLLVVGCIRATVLEAIQGGKDCKEKKGGSILLLIDFWRNRSESREAINRTD